MRVFVGLVLLGGFSLPSCTHPKVANVAMLAHPAQGAWLSVERGQDDGGDTYVDTHEVLVKGNADGWVMVWDRARTWRTTDAGKVFRDGRGTRCSVAARVLLQGRARVDGTVLLEHKADLPRESQCEGTLPSPQLCSLSAEKNHLHVTCGQQKTVFFPKQQVSPPLLFAALGPSGRISGVWTWHHRSIDAEGDLKIEHETWHLFQRGGQVEGFYDRVVAIRSRDGRRFLCNDGLGYRSSARFLLRGKIVGQKLRLHEVSYRTDPGRCDTGRRSLDRYVGVLQRKDGEIRLHWRSGGQLLRRRR
ncbi:MAG: hypothetical protein JRH20_03850 [Deltaproteobacteria bacterium]|nr:hypothetical protein [Deltaproteobacteria bacterium]